MANITINEVSQTYTYNIGTNSYATVALPITSSWGPGYFDPATFASKYSCGTDDDTGFGYEAMQSMLDSTVWQRFPATREGMESFVQTYRGPASGFRLIKDYSYQYALTLLTAGYDVLVCRICPGKSAVGELFQDENNSLKFTAKYPGSFGNNIMISIRKVRTYNIEDKDYTYYWNIVTYVIDNVGTKYAAETVSMTFDVDDSSDLIPYYKEVESKFWEVTVTGKIVGSADAVVPHDKDNASKSYIILSEGSDWGTYRTSTEQEVTDPDTGETSTETVESIDAEALSKYAKIRYDWAAEFSYGSYTEADVYDAYPQFLSDASILEGRADSEVDMLISREWILSALVGPANSVTNGVGGVFDLLKDKLAYNPQRIISPGWDDQDYYIYDPDFEGPAGIDASLHCAETCPLPVSPLSLKLMDVAYHSRCATSLIDIPHCVDRRYVYIDDTSSDHQGYAQLMARINPLNVDQTLNGVLFHTHSALFAPWGEYTYVGMSRMQEASPSFLALMIQRAQILNQATQYEWALPTDRKHNLRIGKLAYTVPKKLLDQWQNVEGASLNVITNIPDLGTNLWGNSTIYEVPPASYQALANLSTRYLVNAIENVAYKVGISITFQYNNDQAYNKFYAGVTPILDTMRNVGAIEDYYVRMAADVDSLDQVMANTVVGKIYLVINGVINDIVVDLVCLPPGSDIAQYQL